MTFISTIEISTKSFFKATLPLAPGINQSYKIVRVFSKGGMVYRLGPTQELDLFKAEAAAALAYFDSNLQDWSTVNAIRESKQKVPLRVDLKFFFKSMWKRDVDGCIKHEIDAIFEHMKLNDNLILEIRAQKFVDASNPRCEIEVTSLLAQ